MIRTGLVSITFRQLAPREIVDLVARAGLEGLEWGGDVHVPHGEADLAGTVGKMTREAGLAVAAYGSYYRAGEHMEAFEPVLETAVALGASLIRVWAGHRGSADADDAFRAAVVEDSRRIADLAAAAGVRIAYEYHGHSLTDTKDSAVALLRAVEHENVGCTWQPPRGLTAAECLDGLDAIAPHLSNVHVFSWHPETDKRLALAEGEAHWAQYLHRIAAVPGDRYALLEFVRDNDPRNFPADAETLKEWLRPLTDPHS
jgi:3-dehydroshikimate dehydratase